MSSNGKQEKDIHKGGGNKEERGLGRKNMLQRGTLQRGGQAHMYNKDIYLDAALHCPPDGPDEVAGAGKPCDSTTGVLLPLSQLKKPPDPDALRSECVAS
jgi:hypothetical protein